MFISKKCEDVSDEDFDELVSPHSDAVANFMADFIFPEVVAYYIATGFYKSCIWEEKFDVLIGTVNDLFNYHFVVTKKLKESISHILLIKYGLKLIGENPLALEIV